MFYHAKCNLGHVCEYQLVMVHFVYWSEYVSIGIHKMVFVGKDIIETRGKGKWGRLFRLSVVQK